MSRSLAFLAILLSSSVATAHFPWLYLTDEAYPRLFFGESLGNQDYHLPETVAKAKVWQTGIDAPPKPLPMKPHEEEGFTGLEGEDVVEPRGRLQASLVYGSYHGSKLTYYAQHFPADNPQAWPTADAPDLPMQATLTREGDRLLAKITWQGKPLDEASASLTSEQGGDSIKGEALAGGVVAFQTSDLVEGLNGLTVMHVDRDDADEVNGEAYTSASHILTATFYYDPNASAKASALPPLPEAVASFGAAVSGEWLYVYGGHIGQAHDHSRDNLSTHFRRIKLDGAGGWKELPMGQPLQGLPLVAHEGKLYRLGGLDARNASGEEEELHSVADFARFDPETREWTEMPALPEGRSSHNAVVIGDTLYAVGGWRLHGDDDGEWQAGALAFDLKKRDADWRQLAEPPFKRRALAISHLDGKVVVLCGMTDEADLSKAVYFYDPASEQWSEGPEFPGRAFHGFGLSAWNLDGTLYAGGMEGTLYRLSNDRTEWFAAGEFATKRFFHQLVPDGSGSLLAVAGASPEEGHTNSIERLQLRPEAANEQAAKEPAKADATDATDPKPSADEVSLAEPVACPGDRWPMFRGVGTSVSAAKELPSRWSDSEGIAWRSELPG